MELENIGYEPAKKGPVNGGNVRIARNDTGPCFASDKTVKEEAKNSTNDSADYYLNHSFFSHNRIYQSYTARSI
jgi:hypothetical protein